MIGFDEYEPHVLRPNDVELARLRALTSVELVVEILRREHDLGATRVDTWRVARSIWSVETGYLNPGDHADAPPFRSMRRRASSALRQGTLIGTIERTESPHPPKGGCRVQPRWSLKEHAR